jgi:hypothetical protein
LEVDESLERVFAAASSVKSIVMTSEEMERDKTDFEDLITNWEDAVDNHHLVLFSLLLKQTKWHLVLALPN